MQNLNATASLHLTQPRIRQEETPVISRVHAILDVVDFCETAPQSSGLRCLSIRGKSVTRKESFMEEVNPILRKSHQVLLHLKFYPESDNEIVPALTKTLRDYNHAHNLIKDELDGSVGSVIQTIRWLSHIRITVVIVEHFDVLTEQGRSELSSIFRSLADSRLSVLLVSESQSPVDTTAFEPYLSGSIIFGGEPQKEPILASGGILPNPLTNGIAGLSTPTATAITFFGSIALKGPAGMRKMQGGRTKKVLSLLVAQALMNNTLSLQDFCRIATGEEDDLDRARNIIYIAVHRLRQTFGEEVILKTSPVPQINATSIDIDILQANTHLDEALAAIRKGYLLQAVTHLRTALEIWHGEVLFPGLYDEFFESARDEFEFKLSSAIVKIAKSLIAEGDIAQAHSVLEFAYPWLKEDQAIGDLYNKTLSNAGKFMSLQSLERE